MRILHLADLHVHLTGPRAAECRRVLDHIALTAKDAKPDVIVIPGDLYDRRSTPEERLYMAEFLLHLSDAAPVFAINGNHDDIEDVRLFRAEYGWRESIVIATEPQVVNLVNGSLALLPWPNLGNLAKAVPGASIALRREAAKAALLDVVRGFQLDPRKPSLLLAHMPVTGASMDSGQPVSGGDEIALSADELLESGAAGVALGHIHFRQQILSSDGRPVFYSGAPFRCNFGEATGTKGGLLWEWNGKAWDVTPWELPARKMILLEGKWEDGGIAAFSDADLDVKDAEVRLRIEFPTEDRDAVRQIAEGAKATLELAGAFSVTVDERPIAVARIRCADITAARTTADKLIAWAQAVGMEIPAGALEKLSTLEMEVRA